MKYLYYISSIFLILFLNNSFSQTLIVNENFNENQLDPVLWKPIADWGPNYSAGDLQFYQGDNVEISNGTAKLKLLYQPGYYNTWSWDPYGNLVLVPKYFDYTGGSIFSKNKYLYGTFEIRCKIPENSGAAFWLFGQCCEEIDVFEFLSTDRTEFSVTIHECKSDSPCNCDYQRDHDGDPNSEDNWHCHQLKGVDRSPGPDFSDDFHTWTLVWTPNEIAILVDYQVVRKCSESGTLDDCNPIAPGTGHLYPNNPMNIILNIAAAPYTPFGTNDVMEIDYIRIWDGTNPPECASVSFEYDENSAGLIDEGTTNVSDHLEVSTVNQSSEVKFLSGSNRVWTAGNYIEFNSVFEIEDGAQFMGEIVPCMPSCDFCKGIDSANTNNEINVVNVNPLSANGLEHSVNNSLNKEESHGNVNANILLTPNPSTGVFTIHNPYKIVCYVTIIDVIGRVITQTVINDQHSEINLSSHPRGIYFLKVITRGKGQGTGDEGKIYTEKIILQ